MMENPDGRIFIHSLGNGAILLVIERDGQNMQIIVEPQNALKIGKMLFIDLGFERMEGGMPKYDEAEEPPVLELPAPAPKTATQEARKAKLQEVANAYRTARDSYWSARCEHTGRTAYVADELDVSYTNAKWLISQARKAGLLTHKDRGRKGRKPLERP